MDNKRMGEGGYTLLYIIGDPPRPSLGGREEGREGERKTEICE